MTVTKWTPDTNLMRLRRLGKLGEELNECGAVSNRCIIQGLLEIDPSSGLQNSLRLQNEMADVLAQIECTIVAFGFNRERIQDRVLDKISQMREWEDMFTC
jgi:hypothetical protein